MVIWRRLILEEYSYIGTIELIYDVGLVKIKYSVIVTSPIETQMARSSTSKFANISFKAAAQILNTRTKKLSEKFVYTKYLLFIVEEFATNRSSPNTTDTGLR